VTKPLAYVEPHSSADSLADYRGGAFGEEYEGNLFLAEWAST